MKHGKTFEELAAELYRRKEMKHDYVVDTSVLTMDASPNNAQMSMRNDATNQTYLFNINEIAHNQIGTKLGIPAKYYDKMRIENPELLAQNVNSWFKLYPEKRMVRTLDGTIRAFLTDKYRRIDNFEIMAAVYPIIKEMPDANIESCEVTDERLYLKVVNPRLTTDVVPGDTVQSGILITNSEVGLGSFTVSPLVYRLVCSNGMVVNDAKTRKYHVGRANTASEDYSIYSDETVRADDRALMLKFQDMVRTVVDRVKFEAVVDKMRRAKGAEITTSNIPAMVELAGSDFGYSLQEASGILDCLIRGEDLTLYGFANATTQFAQTVQSYDRSTQLESIGYNIMTMSNAKWNKLQNASVGEAA